MLSPGSVGAQNSQSHETWADSRCIEIKNWNLWIGAILSFNTIDILRLWADFTLKNLFSGLALSSVEPIFRLPLLLMNKQGFHFRSDLL